MHNSTTKQKSHRLINSEHFRKYKKMESNDELKSIVLNEVYEQLSRVLGNITLK